LLRQVSIGLALNVGQIKASAILAFIFKINLIYFPY